MDLSVLVYKLLFKYVILIIIWWQCQYSPFVAQLKWRNNMNLSKGRLDDCIKLSMYNLSLQLGIPIYCFSISYMIYEGYTYHLSYSLYFN